MMPAEPVGGAVQAGKKIVSAIVADRHHLPVGLAKRADLIARQIVDSQPHPKIVRHGQRLRRRFIVASSGYATLCGISPRIVEGGAPNLSPRNAYQTRPCLHLL